MTAPPRASLDLPKLVAEVTTRIDGYRHWAGDAHVGGDPRRPPRRDRHGPAHPGRRRRIPHHPRPPGGTMTETRQPDPQVVAGVRAVLGKRPDATDKQLIDAYYTWHATPDPDAVRAAIQAARKPLTVADIPAGQGPASLSIGRAPDGCPVLTFKDEDGDLIALEHGNPTTPSGRAYWDHLAATLPHVITEEEA